MSEFNFNLTPTTVPKVDTKYRKIVTQLPVPESLEIIQTLYQYESSSMHGQIPMIIDDATLLSCSEFGEALKSAIE